MNRERMIVRSYRGRGKLWAVVCPRCGHIAPRREFIWAFQDARGWRLAIDLANRHAAWHGKTDGSLAGLLPVWSLP